MDQETCKIMEKGVVFEAYFDIPGQFVSTVFLFQRKIDSK